MTTCQRREADFGLCRQVQQQQQRRRNTAPTGHDERRTKQRGNDKSATASGSATAINGRTAPAMTTGNALNMERRSDNEGMRINGIDAKDGHGSSRTHGKSAR
ncbi:hypothetical protein BDZ89DRAFT_1070970 [Hymenopellis radicata]|nr:hypothetical protein BDZ89DRAFT_1070970 [Hymenopellis radicata]